MKKSNTIQTLRFRFLPSLFVVDDASYKGTFKTEPVKALYNLGFDVRPVATVDDAGLFLWQVADSFITELSRTGRICVSMLQRFFMESEADLTALFGMEV